MRCFASTFQRQRAEERWSEKEGCSRWQIQYIYCPKNCIYIYPFPELGYEWRVHNSKYNWHRSEGYGGEVFELTHMERQEILYSILEETSNQWKSVSREMLWWYTRQIKPKWAVPLWIFPNQLLADCINIFGTIPACCEQLHTVCGATWTLDSSQIVIT